MSRRYICTGIHWVSLKLNNQAMRRECRSVPESRRKLSPPESRRRSYGRRIKSSAVVAKEREDRAPIVEGGQRRLRCFGESHHNQWTQVRSDIQSGSRSSKSTEPGTHRRFRDSRRAQRAREGGDRRREILRKSRLAATMRSIRAERRVHWRAVAESACRSAIQLQT